MVLCVSIASAQGPNSSGTYYQNANGKKGEALKTALCNIIGNPDVVGYSGLNEKYKLTDKRADGYLRDWYSNATSYTWDDTGGNSAEGAGWNKEHTVPQSWFSEASPMKSDIVHVVPTDCYVNNRRGSYVLAEVNNITWSSRNQYSKLGSCKTTGYTSTVFEPNDEIKGDIARIYFYMATCYEGKFTSWTKGESQKIFTSTNYPGLQSWVLDMFVRWSQQDPIDDVEIARNNAVYQVQGNRNPFVDYPGLEDYIWGSKQNQQFYYDNYEGGETAYVAMPTFSPDAGTYYQQVEVTLATSSEGAEIYYTTDGADASEQSIPYAGPFTLTETATIKAVAIKDGHRSSQSTARYVITNQDPEQPVDGQINLNNTLFATSYSGAISNNSEDFVGTQNGVTVVYSLDGGSNRYCNDEQIRLYPGNKLTLSVQQSAIEQLQFLFADTPESKNLEADGMALNEGLWTGDKQSVTVTLGSGKHSRLTGVIVKVKGSATSINTASTALPGKRVVYNLQGQRVLNPSHGVYIVDGKKVLLP